MLDVNGFAVMDEREKVRSCADDDEVLATAAVVRRADNEVMEPNRLGPAIDIEEVFKPQRST